MCLFSYTYACDVCGCGAASQGLGMLPQFYKHFVGMQYQYRNFSAIHPGLTETSPEERSIDQYNTTQLWGRFQPSEHLQLFAFVPYQYNVQKPEGKATTTQSGIGDITLMANAIAIKKTDSNGNAQLLLAGGGVKLPTGRHNGTLPNSTGLPEPQPGTGSWDFLLNANYTIKHKSAGLNTEASYTLTTANKDAYKYGNRLSAAVRAFYMKELGDFTLLPQIGGKYDFALHDYDNYDRKWLNNQTGGSAVYATAAVQAFYRKIGMQIGYNYPLAQNYAQGNVTIKPQLDAGIFLLF
ncbi:MAG: hypothetical protein EOP51_10660 [Sphingobacteriales bacterium]|nr:MAG: hypothetical protein EOP51_10660 [Sphingobacteriales bacterium]